MIYLFAILTFVCTFLGGIFAFKFKDKLHLISGFSAGAILGLAFFHLIPEAMKMSEGSFEASQVAVIFAIAFVVYMILDRLFLHHSHESSKAGHNHEAHEHAHIAKRPAFLGVTSLSFHSLFDGIAIGLSFQVSTMLGLTVALAVLAHDFSDGINTVNFVLKSTDNKKSRIFKWLFVDSIAPVIGIIIGTLVHVPNLFIGVVVAVFAGFFTYLGASELLPESYHNHPTWLTTVATIVGMAVIYVVIQFAETL